MGLLYRELLADNLKNREGFDDAYKRVSHFSNPYSAAGMRNLSRKFGRADGIRTHTLQILSLLPLPLGYYSIEKHFLFSVNQERLDQPFKSAIKVSDKLVVAIVEPSDQIIFGNSACIKVAKITETTTIAAHNVPLAAVVTAANNNH